MGALIIQADILDWARTYDGPLFHALLCDAPYHLTSGNLVPDVYKCSDCGRVLGGRDGSPDRCPKCGGDLQRQRSQSPSKGFMGKSWDGVDENGVGIAFNPETWRLLARCLHPGAFLFVFAGTINDDLISMAMREAGLRKYHKAAAWSYGSGFPKAARLDTVIDRRAGVERTKVGTKKHQPKFAAAELGYREKDNGYNSKERESFDVTAPATELAQAWQGHRYGGQMLKPALETILIFQKPYDGRPVDSITATGAGALWVDGGRIGTGDVGYFKTDSDKSNADGPVHFLGDSAVKRGGGHDAGRWPANLILSHHPLCNGDCHPDCAVLALGRQSGEIEAKRTLRGGVNMGSFGGIVLGEWETRDSSVPRGHDDTGTAARFFFQADYMAERLEATDAVIYEAKADRSEREAGLDPRQVRLLGMMEVEGAAPQRAALNDRKCRICGGWYPKAHRATRRPDSTCQCADPDWGDTFEKATINDGRAKSIDNAYQRGETTRRNTHPTIKPIALARHLATLLLPPDLYTPRRLLIPFAGAGSEMIGALLAGWEDIIGVELEVDHVRIAEARLAYWRQRQHEFADPSKPITAALSDAPDGQLELF